MNRILKGERIMARKCKCCARDIVGSKCSYCKYINVEVLDNPGSECELERAAQYKAGLLERITDFSINAYTYKWDQKTSKFESGRLPVKITDGKECYEQIVWSKKAFEKNPDDRMQERDITISYMFDGEQKEINVKLKTIQCNDLWRLGVMIHQDLTVSFYLGTVDNYTVSGPFNLELK